MSGQALVRRLDWDSAFFGFPIARLEPGRPDAAALDRALAWCGGQSIRCLYFLADADAAESHRRAEERGFQLVDIRMTLQADGLPPPLAGAEGVRPGVAGDIADLLPMARVAHTDSRFFTDAHFDRERSAALYETWLKQSFADYAEAVLVAEDRSRAAGYITCHLREGNTGQIGLVGVGEAFRGRGLGRSLVAAARNWFAGRGCEKVLVVTQGANVPAQRLYQAAGFRTRQVQLWYHRWFAEARES